MFSLSSSLSLASAVNPSPAAPAIIPASAPRAPAPLCLTIPESAPVSATPSIPVCGMYGTVGVITVGGGAVGTGGGGILVGSVVGGSGIGGSVVGGINVVVGGINVVVGGTYVVVGGT